MYVYVNYVIPYKILSSRAGPIKVDFTILSSVSKLYLFLIAAAIKRKVLLPTL